MVSKTGFFASLRNSWQHFKDRQKVWELIILAAQDGVLTDEEVAEIQEKITEVGLTEQDLILVRAKAYEVAFNAVAFDRRITEDEEHELLRLKKFLMIPDEEVASTKKALDKLRLLAEIESGSLPTASIPGLVLEAGEVAHWSERGTLVEEKEVSLGYRGGTTGMNVKISKSITYRVAAQKGTLVTEKRMVDVCGGRFFVTSNRCIFHGDTKAFTVRLSEVSGVKYYTDGIGITDKKDKVRIVRYDSKENADALGLIISKLLSKIQEHQS